MNEEQIKNIVAFCVLMQNGPGIISKSPDYIREKFKRYCTDHQSNSYAWGLDGNNKQKFNEWIERWLTV